MAPKDSWTGAARGPSFLGCSHRGWRSVAAAARKNAQKGKKGRVFILVHTYYKAQPISVRCAGKTSFRRYRCFLALDTSAEWSDPIKGFQHRGMIPVLGPRGATPHAHAYRRSRVRSPVRPTLIFLSLESTLRERPPYATAEPRGARIINLAGSRGRRGCWGSSGHARPPALVSGQIAAKTSAWRRTKNTRPPKLVLKVREVLIFKVVVLPITLGRRVRERRLHFRWWRRPVLGRRRQ